MYKLDVGVLYIHVTFPHSHCILTNHAIKNIVFQVFKVVVDLLMCCDSRIIHKILSLNADLPLILIFCDALVVGSSTQWRSQDIAVARAQHGRAHYVCTNFHAKCRSL